MTFLDNHRGPFTLVVTRTVKKLGFFATEWLTGSVERDEVESEANALLSDPRDAIVYVSVWSEREQCFVGGYRRAVTS